MANKWKSFYTIEAEIYNRRRYASWYGRLFAQLHHAALQDVLRGRPPDHHILDLASGTGHNLPMLLNCSRLVVACDLTAAMLKESRKEYRAKSNIAYSVGDALILPFADNTFDVVASARFLHLFSKPHQQVVLGEMVRVLKPGGLLLVDFYNNSHWRLLSPLINIYRLVKKKRPTEDTRNSVRDVHQWLRQLSVRVHQTVGISSYLLLLLRILPQAQVFKVGQVFRHPPFRCLSEQFLIAARKQP
jgi:ubiquinone/menaquinone biosynthesis C-methylase UbiE